MCIDKKALRRMDGRLRLRTCCCPPVPVAAAPAAAVQSSQGEKIKSNLRSDEWWANRWMKTVKLAKTE